MSLRIWLPLNKDLRNLGTCNSSVTGSNVTISSSGKLGNCYSFNGTNSYLFGTHNFMSNDISDWTFSCWMKMGVTNTNQCLFSCRTEASASGITIFYLAGTWAIDDGVRWAFTPTTTISANKWYHICVVRKKDVGKYLYIDGVLDSSTTTVGTQTKVSTTNYSIGSSQQNSTTVSGNPFNGFINDVRIYDHSLSLAEIKEISKGLVCHYKLDEFYSSSNLIVNGRGELGTENWNTSSISTTEIPSNHSEIKASMYSGNSTKQYIPIIKNHSYTISGYIKASASSGTTYPSIYTYDKDKKFINTFNNADGFSSTSKTTLSQPLHKGDTVIHATDLSNWSTSTSNYYFHVAIFGYKNSFGDVFADMTYTQDSPSFGSYSDKSNIDKTNNTITLKYAFTGEDRPAGTTICQATEGATYYYPWGGISVASIQDWTFKTGTFKPSSVNRLRFCEYIRWSTYSRCYIAGSTLVDNNATDTKVIDVSGYGYHATRSGNVTISTNTPRYSYSTKFDTNAHIVSTLVTAGYTNTYTFSWWGKFTKYSGTMMWGFSNGNRLNLYMYNGNFYWNTGDSANNPFSDVSASTYADDNWHLFVVTGDGTTTKLYIDGVFRANAKTFRGITGTSLYMNGWAASSAYNFNGQLSDFRLYATPLSANDILALYNVGARISKNGAMMSYEMKES